MHSRKLSAQEQHVCTHVCISLQACWCHVTWHVQQTNQSFQACLMTCHTRQVVQHTQHHEQLTGVVATCTEHVSFTACCNGFSMCALVEARAKVQEGIRRLCENGSCKRWQWTTDQPLFCDEKAFRCVLSSLSRIHSSTPDIMFAITSDSGPQHALPKDTGMSTPQLTSGS